MFAHALAALARPRIPLLAALFALAALAVAVLAPPTSAAPPDDLTLTLSLIEDSDNIVPAGSSLQLRAALSSTTQDPEALDISGTLRVSGDQEWEHNGRSSYSVATQYTSPSPNDASTGWVVAVQERTAAEGGDIVAVGAWFDDIGGVNRAGSVDLFVAGRYQKRLTAPTPAATSYFGQAVDVGGGYVVVGERGANKAYIYNEEGTLLATLSASSPIGQFGFGVGIDDSGETIVVGSRRGYSNQNTSGAAYIFTKPTGGWADATTSTAATVTGHQAGNESGKNVGGVVGISGNGEVVIIGARFRDTDTSATTGTSTNAGNDHNGGVLVFVKPDDDEWDTSAADTTPDARLLADDDIFRLRVGTSVAINKDGSVIAASGNGHYGTVKNVWAGAAYVWEMPTGGWSTTAIQPDGFKLTDAENVNGDLFGHKVAVSDSGNRVIVSNAWKSADDYKAGEAHIFDKPAGGWADDDTADTVLTSPQSEAQLFFGFGVAIDGENTVIIGQTENIEFLGADSIFTDHGRAYSFDLSAADPQASAVRLNGDMLPCSSILLDETTTWTCPVDLDTTPGQAPMITIPAGTPDGTFTISANFAVDGKENITATLPVTIGTVNEADHAEFDFAQDPGDVTITGDKDEKPYPSAIPAGESTRLQLKILSSMDRPAAANSVGSLLFTTTSGSLRLLKPAGAASGTCALTCQVDVRRLNAANSGDIVVELTHPGVGKSGTATVRAQVLPKTGGSLLEVPSVTVTFSGEAAKLVISEPATGVLNVNTATGTNDDAETRDRLRLSVSATDASGNNANVPASGSTRILDPEGKVVWRSSSPTSNFAVAWPLKKADGVTDDKDADDNLQVQIDVNAPDTAPLKNGEYTLEVTANSLKATQTFTVSGGPETIVISEPDSDALTIGGRFTLTATLTDADGGAVPDGTPVTFKASATGAQPVLVEVRKTAKTTDGQASVTYEVIAAGRDSVRVSSGAAGEVRLITTTDSTPVAPPAPVNPADSLTPRMPNDYSTWLGQGSTTAAALLDGLGSGFRSILFWDEGRWLRYAVSDGRPVPSSMNFEVPRGAILWLSNGG